MGIRIVEKQDKEAWYALDKHLPESVFDEKVRCGQRYVYIEFVVDVLGYEQPMETIMIKAVFNQLSD